MNARCDAGGGITRYRGTVGLARNRRHIRLTTHLLSGVVCAWALPISGAATGDLLVDEFLRAADQGHCIEGVTFQLIQRQGPAEAATIVRAALAAHTRREQQQRALGCAGDIAAQAISAGADPDQVLEATAAGL